MATVLTPEALARQRETLYNQQQQATIQQAQQSAMGQRAQLSQSLSAARQDYESARLQAQEGFYQRNRDVLTATSMRGLADSGQANIAEVQSQTAYGETLSGLYGQKQAVEQQAVQQRQIIEQGVAAATTEANLQRGRQQLESDTQLFQQAQAIDDNKKAQVASLVELSMSGQYTPQQLKTLSEAYGITEEDLTIVMNASSYFDPTGEFSLKEKWDWGDTLAATGTAAAAGAIFGLPGIAVGAVIGFLSSTAQNLATNWSKQMTIKGPQGLEFTGGPADITQQVNQYYSGFEGSDQIAASVDFSPTGQADKIVFNYRGQKYNTYNEALAALKGVNRNQE